MKKDIILKVENISKQYRLGLVGTGTIGHDLNRWWYKVRGKENPYIKVGESNDRTSKGNSDYVWALSNINFEVKKGEVLGIIGKNGAGKSTLLKILSKITTPSTGFVGSKGTIASLLEVGTGFHGELTGRENIYLNGAILGMTKVEISNKINDIIAFSGCERYIDTPVKRYSSGMSVRLAFAVAAFLEPDILIIDEVLAVGDAEFQKKAIGKMQDISKTGGRTVLFVSHNMAAVKSLCTRAIVLNNGEVTFNGGVNEAVAFYLNGNIDDTNYKAFNSKFDTDVFCLKSISVNSEGKSSKEILDEFQSIELVTDIDIKNNAENLHFTYVVKNDSGISLFTISHINSNLKLQKGINKIKCKFPKGYLNIGTYYLDAYLIKDRKEAIFVEQDIFSFTIQVGQRNIGGWMGKEPGFIKPIFDWDIKLMDDEN